MGACVPILLVSCGRRCSEVLRAAVRLGGTLLLLFLGCPIADAQCVDYRGYLHREGGVDLPSRVDRLAVSGGYAYLGGQTHGLYVVDIQAGPDPRLVGSLELDRWVNGVATAGDHVLCVSGSVHEWPPSEWGALVVVDMSDPSSPTQTARLDLPSCGCDIAVSGPYAYVACYGQGLIVIDIQDPGQPLVVGNLWTYGVARSVAVSGSLAYVGFESAYEGGFVCVIDVAVPEAPRLLGTVATPGVVYGVATRDGLAAAAQGDSGVELIDVSDPSNPVLLGHLDTPPASTSVSFCDGVLVAGFDGYLGFYGGGGVLAIDISQPASPRIVGRVDTGAAGELAAIGDQVFVARPGPVGDGSLEVIDATRPESPVVLGSLEGSIEAGNLAMAGTLACVAAVNAGGTSGLLTVELEDPGAPEVQGFVGIPGGAHDVAVAGHHAFVTATYPGRFFVVDIGVPSAPRIVADLPAPWEAAVSVLDGIACVVNLSSLQLVDISDAGNPEPRGDCDPPFPALDVVLAGHHACVAGQGFAVVDLVDPWHPQVQGILEVSGGPISADGVHAFTGGQVIRFDDPAHPVVVGSYPVPYRTGGLVLSGDVLYVADICGGLHVIDVGSPDHPTTMGSLPLPCYASGVAVSEGVACVALGEAGIRTVPLQCDPVDAPDPVDGRLRARPRAFPNPTAGAVWVRLTAPGAGPLRAAVHNVTGRVVRRLVPQDRIHGDPELFWDGRDDAGKEVAPGVYLLRASTGEAVESARIVRIR